MFPLFNHTVQSQGPKGPGLCTCFENPAARLWALAIQGLSQLQDPKGHSAAEGSRRAQGPSASSAPLAKSLFITAAPGRFPTSHLSPLPSPAANMGRALSTGTPNGSTCSPRPEQGPRRGLGLPAHTSGLLCPVPQPRMPLHSCGTVLTFHCSGSTPGGGPALHWPGAPKGARLFLYTSGHPGQESGEGEITRSSDNQGGGHYPGL